MTRLPHQAVPHTIHIHLGADALTVLTRHWPALYAHDAQSTPFQSPAWLTGIARHLPARTTPLILTATTASDRIVAALALTRHRDRTGTRFRPLSAPHATPVRLTGPHAEDDAIAEAIALHLLMWQNTGADIALPGLRADTALGRAIRTVCQDNLTTPVPASPALALPFRFDALAPSRQREHTRRCRHWARLAAAHTVTYRRSHQRQTLLAGLKVLVALQEAAQRHTTAPACPVAWRKIVLALGTQGAFVADLHIDDIPVAAQLCLTRGRRCYSAAQTSHPRYRHLAPAHALLRHLLDDLAQEGFHSLDPGHGTTALTPSAPGPSIRLAA